MFSSPSIVTTDLPARSPISAWQERTAAPSIWTVQAPHCATPQPYLGLVMPSSSRSTQSNGISGTTSTLCLIPLTAISIMSACPFAMSSFSFRWPQSKPSYRSLGDGYVLFDGPGACSHCADDASVQRDRNAAAENDDLAGVRLLDAVEGSAGLRQAGQIGGLFVEDPRRRRLIDGKVDASDKRAVLARKRQQMAAGIDYGDVIR